jgi:hypothetical protein
LASRLQKGKVLVVFGPRRSGKTTLLTTFLKTTRLKYRLDSGDNIRVQQILGSRDFPLIREYLEDRDLLVVDEAQEIPDIGKGLKIIVDLRPDLRVIATGSSSFDLARQIGEPLTGRKRTIILFPLSVPELKAGIGAFDLRERLDELLVFGTYPEVVRTRGRANKIRLLDELVQSYLFKDILAHERIKGSRAITDLVRLLAFQIGRQVSLNELAGKLKIDVKTVQRYLDLLEKSFVILPLAGFGRNLRKEIVTMKKYYFIDNGIRNAVLSRFTAPDMREDAGLLWESFVIVERMKKRFAKEIVANAYFWRTYDGQEIDLVEERNGTLHGYECKWSSPKKVKMPGAWMKTYPSASYEVIHRENALKFIG